MAVEYTPGPWKPERITVEADWMGVAANGRCIGIVHDDAGLMTANANLIAAAPELLEACKQALIVMTNYPVSCEEQHVLCDEKHETPGCSICKVIRALSAAIAKARGEPCQ